MANENNTTEKVDYTKNLKEVGDFVNDKVKPLIAKVIASKASVKDALDKVAEIKAELTRQAQEELQRIEEEEKALAGETAVEESSQPTVDTEETLEESVAETVETPEEAKTEVKEEVKTTAPVEEVKAPRKEERPVHKPSQPRTYINPDAQIGGRRDGQRPQGAYNNQRPQGDKPRRPGAPQGQQGGYQRPQSGMQTRVFEAPVQANNNNQFKKDNKKKQGVKDDNKKGLSKRDLLKKGYVYEGGDDEDGQVRHVKVRKTGKKEVFTPQAIVIEHAVINTDPVAIKVLSEKIGKTSTEIVKKLFDMGKFATINDSIDFDTAEFVALDYGITLELKQDTTAEDKLNELTHVEYSEDKMKKRPPIVTIMGHVDHGKTSLLDYIRKSNVARGEAGGITQHIGAYSIEVNGEKITFLDTPGHQAFTAMRRRGANVTDIAVIVVAADDGIMPQTVEAINHAKDAGVSIIIAANKIDKPTANLENLKQQLAAHDVLVEEWGGDVMMCPVSAKTGQGVPELLEGILLVAEVLDLKAVEDCPAQGSIIEARLDKGLGPVATVLVQSGTLHVSDYVVAGTCIGKIRSMTDFTGKRVKEAKPSFAAQVQGFTEVPNAGDKLVVVSDEKLAKEVAAERAAKERIEMQNRTASAKTLEDMFKNVSDEEVKSLAVIIKADVQGSAEAMKQSLLEISDKMKDDNVKISIIHAGVGAISEGDVNLAYTSNAIILAFNVKAEPKARQLAERSSIEIRYYRVIYEAIEDIQSALKGMLEPVYKEEIVGHAEVRATFRISGVGLIAGCYVTDGKVARTNKARLIRDNIVVFYGNIASLKREKSDAKEVASGYECGIGLEKFGDIKEGDVIEAYEMIQVKNE